MADFTEVIDLLKNGEARAAWHKLGELLHGDKDASTVHTLDEGSGGTQPPPTPPKTPPTHG